MPSPSRRVLVFLLGIAFTTRIDGQDHPGGPFTMDDLGMVLARLFQTLDRDGDGKLSSDELPFPDRMSKAITSTSDLDPSMVPGLLVPAMLWTRFRVLGGDLDQPIELRGIPAGVSSKIAFLDHDGDGWIAWTEFSADPEASSDLTFVNPLVACLALIEFDRRDVDHDGCLRQEEVASGDTMPAGHLPLQVRQFLDGTIPYLSQAWFPALRQYDRDRDLRVDGSELDPSADLWQLDANHDGVLDVWDHLPADVASSPRSTPSRTGSPPPLSTPGSVATSTPRPTPSPTPSPSPTSTPVPTPTSTPSPTPTSTPSPTPTSTPSPTPTPTPGSTPAPTPAPAGTPFSARRPSPAPSFPWIPLLVLGVIGGGAGGWMLRRRGRVPAKETVDSDLVIARSHFRSNRYEEAAHRLQMVIRKQGPEVSQARALLVRAFLRAGQRSPAQTQANLLDTSGLDLATLHDLAQDLQEAGLDESALALYQRIYAQDVAFRDVRQRISQLEKSPSKSVTEALDGSAQLQKLSQRYKDPTKVGAGGMGVIYRVFDTVLQREVALKIIQPGLVSDHEVCRRFLREARALARLAHPNILPVLDISMEPVPYYSTPYLRGSSLAGYLETATLTLGDRFRMAIDVVAALDHAHARGVLHRDIKPENVFITQESKAYLLDFGLAHLEQATRITGTGQVMGSLRYIAPELLQGAKGDARSDLYSLGLTLFEIFTSSFPFDGNLASAFEARRPPPASERNQELSGELDQILDRTLDHDPDRRHSSASELLRELERAAATSLSNTPPRGEAKRILAIAAQIDRIYRRRIHSLPGIFGIVQRLASAPERAAGKFFGSRNLDRLAELAGAELGEEIEHVLAASREVSLDGVPQLRSAIEFLRRNQKHLVELPGSMLELRGRAQGEQLQSLRDHGERLRELAGAIQGGLRSMEIDLEKVLDHATSGLPDPGNVSVTLGPLRSLISYSPRNQEEDLTLVFENLFHNAIQTGSRVIRVTSASSPNETHVIVDVWNDGPPVPEEVALELFVKEISTRPDGTGTGLMTCRTLLEKYSSTVALKSRAPVVFQLTLDRGCNPIEGDVPEDDAVEEQK